MLEHSIFELLGWSAGNLLAFDLIGILRDYTLEFFCCNIYEQRSFKHIFTFEGREQCSFKIKSQNNPVAVYSNAELQKKKIIQENRGKTGIYRWTNKVNGKSYIGSGVNLSNRLSKYFSEERGANKIWRLT